MHCFCSQFFFSFLDCIAQFRSRSSLFFVHCIWARAAIELRFYVVLHACIHVLYGRCSNDSFNLILSYCCNFFSSAHSKLNSNWSNTNCFYCAHRQTNCYMHVTELFIKSGCHVFFLLLFLKKKKIEKKSNKQLECRQKLETKNLHLEKLREKN